MAAGTALGFPFDLEGGGFLVDDTVEEVVGVGACFMAGGARGDGVGFLVEAGVPLTAENKN